MPKGVLNIEIFDYIGGWGFNFRALAEQSRGFSGDKIVVPINSKGGDVFEGMLIYNYLKGHKAEVEAHVMTYVMSMGTIIAMAADKVIMPENGWFMIHNPWAVEFGESQDLTRTAGVLDKMTNQMAGIYSKKTGIHVNRIKKMMADETWLDAKEAKKLGFVDELTPAATYQASFNEEDFKLKNIPKELAPEDSAGNSNNSKKTEMSKQKGLLAKIAGLLGLSEDAPQEEVMGAVEKLKEASDEADEQFEGFKTEISGEVDKKIEGLEGRLDKIDASMSAIQKSLKALEADDEEEEEDDSEKKIEGLKAEMEKLTATIASLKKKGGKPGNNGRADLTDTERAFEGRIEKTKTRE